MWPRTNFPQDNEGQINNTGQFGSRLVVTHPLG
jgi:hypothetical protein